MSDVDDRMERADRIRKMRQSRNHDGENDDRSADSDEGEAIDGQADDTAARDAKRADADGESAGASERDGVTESERSESDIEPDVEPQRTEPERTEPKHTEPERTEPEHTELERTEPEHTEPDRADTHAGEVQGPEAGETTAAAVEQRSPAEPAGADDESLPTVGGGIAPLGKAAGASLSAALEEGEASGEEAGDEGVSDDTERAAGSRAGATTAAVTEASVRVLEFTVGEQMYCIDIDRVEEIVKRETVTRVPNTPAYVEGVVDLRGQITTILDTKQLLTVDEGGREELLVIFAPDAFEDHGSVGWVVDEVRQVVPVTDDQVRTPPSDDEHVRGIVDREDDDDLIVWIRPGVTMTRAVERAVGEGTDEA